jgi:ATP-dependent Lhr-like helicase
VSTPSTAFERLHESVRRWVWQQRWNELRDVQEAAIEPILSGSTDVIIMAATAAGKTEAAFLPICSRLVGHSGGSVRALYVGPLKALINDQFARLDGLCEELEIPVHRWHGDVQAGARRDLLERPSGILLITPESLEAQFVVRGTQIERLFAHLDYVVVDELHAFIGNERGRQLQSLLHRLETAIRKRVPRIALSATLGDTVLAAEFLRPGKGDDVRLIQSREGGRELRMQLRGYRAEAPELSRAELRAAQRTRREIELEEVVSGDRITISEHLFAMLRGHDNLIFANARTVVEEYADLLRRMSERQRVPNEFFPHHGNLSKELREDVERLLKDKDRPLNAICTSTLELGIDIGSVHSIAQIGAPPSVAALCQRLGRSGRKPGEASILRMYIVEPEVTADTAPQDAVHPELVQSICMLNLLLAGWFEPPLTGALHLSTLVQQVLSLIAQHGGISAKGAWEILCKSGPFSSVDPRTFAEFLRGLGGHDLITQAKDGTLLAGGLGERIINHYSFFTAFTTPEEYRLVTEGHTLGTLPIDFPIGEGQFLIFAGRRWRVTSIDLQHKVIDLVAAPGGRPPIFKGSGISVHDRVRQQMLTAYRSGDIPAYLDATARDLLTEARANFARLGLVETPIISNGDQALLFPWMGSRVMNTIYLQLQRRDLDVCLDGIAIAIDGHTPDELHAILRDLVADGPANGPQLAAVAADKLLEKYDQFLPEELLSRDYASRRLDPIAAWNTLRRIVDSAPRRIRRRPSGTPGTPSPLLPRVLWSTRDWVSAVIDLQTDDALPCRTVLVPRESVAHALRRGIVKAGKPAALIGTRFITAARAAAEVLAASGIEFIPGEEVLRPLRLRRLFRDEPPLQYFPLDLLRHTLGWDEAFASAIGDLESAGLRPEDLPKDRGPQLDDIGVLWKSVDAAAARSWTRARVLLEAAAVLERTPQAWPFDGPVIAAVTGEASGVEARFIRAIPNAEIAILTGRPLRERYLERLEQLFGSAAADATQHATVARSAGTERDLLATYLFEQPDILADPARPRSGGPDGTVHFEEHGGVESELEAAVDWVARQVLETHTPLEDIAVLMPVLDPIAGLVVGRLRRMPWPGNKLPVHVASGLPFTGTAAGARMLTVVRALRNGLAAEALADLLPAIRTEDERRHLTRGGALDLAYSLGTVGGSAANPRAGLEWEERATRREADLAAQLARAQEDQNDEERSRVARSARDLERLLADLRAIRRGLGALVSILRVIVDGAVASDIWNGLRAFCEEWLLLPGEGTPPPALLDSSLQSALHDPIGGSLTGEDALELIERTLRSVRVPTARFGEPAIYVGTVRSAVGIPFRAVRIIGLAEGALPTAARESPVLPDALRRKIPSATLRMSADHALSEFHDLDRVVRDAEASIVLSAPRMSIDGTEREASSIFIEAAAALGRPNLATGERSGPIPDATALRRDWFAAGARASHDFRLSSPLSPSAWLDHAAAFGGVPGVWRGAALDLDAIRRLSTADGWTALDGAIGSVALPLIPGLSPDRPISASRLRTLLQCPHRFLFESAMGWWEPASPPSLREIGALAYGSLFHRVVESFFRQHGRAFGERQSALPEWERLADALVDQAFDSFCEEYPLVGEAVRRQQRERLRRDVRSFLDYDWGSPRGRTFVAVERAFGSDTPVALTTSGRALYLRGYIDRLDVEDGRTLIRDLKTGRAYPRRGKDTEPDPVRDVQIGVYGMVARQMASQWALPPQIAAAYAYADARRGFERAFRSDFDVLESAARRWLSTAAGLLEAGMFPRTPSGEDCTYCPFEPVCGHRPYERASRMLETATGPLAEFHAIKVKSAVAGD